MSRPGSISNISGATTRSTLTARAWPNAASRNNAALWDSVPSLICYGRRATPQRKTITEYRIVTGYLDLAARQYSAVWRYIMRRCAMRTFVAVLRVDLADRHPVVHSDRKCGPCVPGELRIRG